MDNEHGPHLHLLCAARNRFPGFSLFNASISQAEQAWGTIAKRSAKIEVVTAEEQVWKIAAYCYSDVNQPNETLSPICKRVIKKIKRSSTP